MPVCFHGKLFDSSFSSGVSRGAITSPAIMAECQGHGGQSFMAPTTLEASCFTKSQPRQPPGLPPLWMQYGARTSHPKGVGNCHVESLSHVLSLFLICFPVLNVCFISKLSSLPIHLWLSPAPLVTVATSVKLHLGSGLVSTWLNVCCDSSSC